jgi:hypothetical protein
MAGPDGAFSVANFCPTFAQVVFKRGAMGGGEAARGILA